jgi:hypothetical protein
MIKNNILIEDLCKLIVLKNNIDSSSQNFNIEKSYYDYLFTNKNNKKINKNNKNLINKNREKRVLISLQDRILSIKKLNFNNIHSTMPAANTMKNKKLLKRKIQNLLSNNLKKRYVLRYGFKNGHKQILLYGKASSIIKNLRKQNRLVKKLNFKNRMTSFKLNNKVNNIEILNNKIHYFSTGLPSHIKKVSGLNYEIKNGLIYTTLSPLNNNKDFSTQIGLSSSITKDFFIFLRKFKIQGFNINSIINYNFINNNNNKIEGNTTFKNLNKNINSNNNKVNLNKINSNNVKNTNFNVKPSTTDNIRKITLAHYPYVNQLLTVNGDLKINLQTQTYKDPKNNDSNIRGVLPIELLQRNDFINKNNSSNGNIININSKKKNNKDHLNKDILLKNNSVASNVGELKLRVNKYMKFMQTVDWDIAKYKKICYRFFNDSNKSINNVYTFLNNAFHRMYSYISRPSIIITPNKITIKLFYYKLKNNAFRRIILRKRLGGRKYFKILFHLGDVLSRFFKKPVELILIRVHHLYNESQILADSIGFMTSKKRMRFRRVTRKIFRRTNIIKEPVLFKNKEDKKKAIAHPLSATQTRGRIKPSHLTGITVRLGGRLLSQKVRPRKTVEQLYKGSLSKAKTDFVSTGRFTSKNKRGAFSISVSLGYICI